MYKFYLGSTLLPVAPGKLDLKIKNQNTTVNLINDGQINILKEAGLSEFSFDVFVPNSNYPFTINNMKCKSVLSVFESLKMSKSPFQFIVIRDNYSTNIKVSMEDYQVKEEAKNGTDLTVNVKLKQFRPYGTKKVKLPQPKKEETKQAVVEETPRTNEKKEPFIGCNVIVNGVLHRDSYGQGPGQTRTNYRGKINFINKNGSHTYHITTPDGGWQGWVTADSVEVVD